MLSDPWEDWILRGRFGGAGNTRIRNETEVHIERLVELACPQPGESVLDVGTGDGAVGLRVLDRLGDRGSVTFSDVSASLIERLQEEVSSELGGPFCRFLVASADDLAGVQTASVQLVTMRSVMLFVQDRAAAFHEFSRVLGAGGRLVLFERVPGLLADVRAGFLGLDLEDADHLVAPVRELFARTTEEGAARHGAAFYGLAAGDLVRLADEAGFVDIRLEVEGCISTEPLAATLEAFLSIQPNPFSPTIGEAISTSLGESDAGSLRRAIDAAIRAERGRRVHSGAFLTARAP